MATDNLQISLPIRLERFGHHVGERLSRWRYRAIALAAVLFGAAAWGAIAPIHSDNRDHLFEIPNGTWASRMAGDIVEILPSQIRLTIGVKDVLMLRNLDEVPQIFGSVLIMPGQSFRLPFALAADYQFACTAHASGQMTIIVEPLPAAGWARLHWRIKTFREYMTRQWGTFINR